MFQDLTAAQIIEAVFADHPSANVELRLTETLRTRSLCIQYDETDLHFVRRLLAEEGLSTRIEQLDAEAARQADTAKHARLAGVNYLGRPATTILAGGRGEVLMSAAVCL